MFLRSFFFLTTRLAGLAITPPNTQIALLLLTGDRTCGPLPGAGVGLGPLPADRQPLPVTKPAVAAEVHQTLYVHGYFTTKITFHLHVLIDDLADASYFSLGQLVRSGVQINTSLTQDLLRRRPTDAID